MDPIKKINQDIDDIEKIENIETKGETAKKIKEEIKSEQEKIDLMIEKISNIQPKKYKKYKGLSFEDLSSMFKEEENIDKQIKIYQQITYLIESAKGQLFDES